VEVDLWLASQCARDDLPFVAAVVNQQHASAFGGGLYGTGLLFQ